MSILGNLSSPERTEITDVNRNVERLSLPDDSGELHLPDDSGEFRLSDKLHLPDDSGKETPERVTPKDVSLERLEAQLATPEGLQELIGRHPEKAELWKSQLEAVESLQDPDASPLEIRSAQAKLSVLKGQLLETAVKDQLRDIGMTVEDKQRVLEGETGGTRPDVIAKNDTDAHISAFGEAVAPGGTLSIECKCGQRAYLEDQLKNHIPNQLSGQEGRKALVATSDIRDTPPGLAESVCERYDASLIITDICTADIEKAIKEVAQL